MNVPKSEPPEVCDIHDVALDDYGCWVCGHAGPCEWPPYEWWVME